MDPPAVITYSSALRDKVLASSQELVHVAPEVQTLMRKLENASADGLEWLRYRLGFD
jgi:hypothetical protein